MALMLHFSYPSKLNNFSIRCEDSSSTSNSSSEPTTISSTSAPPSKQTSTSAAGLGFGSTTGTIPLASKKKQQGKKDRASSITRRAPFAKPDFASQNEDIEAKEKGQNENAFLLTWFGLGTLIILEGLVLAASGFLPEEWDKFFVKYLYPSFTPTVFVFVAGTVVYGVTKYLQNEKPQE